MVKRFVYRAAQMKELRGEARGWKEGGRQGGGRGGGAVFYSFGTHSLLFDTSSCQGIRNTHAMKDIRMKGLYADVVPGGYLIRYTDHPTEHNQDHGGHTENQVEQGYRLCFVLVQGQGWAIYCILRYIYIRKKIIKRLFCPHWITCFCSMQNPLHGTKKGSTWNQKGFFKGFSYGDSQRTLLGYIANSIPPCIPLLACL